jgi:hypothetical protein
LSDCRFKRFWLARTLPPFRPLESVLWLEFSLWGDEFLLE